MRCIFKRTNHQPPTGLINHESRSYNYVDAHGRDAAVCKSFGSVPNPLRENQLQTLLSLFLIRLNTTQTILVILDQLIRVVAAIYFRIHLCIAIADIQQVRVGFRLRQRQTIVSIRYC